MSEQSRRRIRVGAGRKRRASSPSARSPESRLSEPGRLLARHLMRECRVYGQRPEHSVVAVSARDLPVLVELLGTVIDVRVADRDGDRVGRIVGPLVTGWRSLEGPQGGVVAVSIGEGAAALSLLRGADWLRFDELEVLEVDLRDWSAVWSLRFPEPVE